MGFSLQEAQWLVKFYRNLPGQGAAQFPEMESAQSEYTDGYYAQAMQAESGYPVGEDSSFEGSAPSYYDEYW
jgi:hypothetical protein